jgi:hypothetical protein
MDREPYPGYSAIVKSHLAGGKRDWADALSEINFIFLPKILFKMFSKDHAHTYILIEIRLHFQWSI